MPNTTPPCQQEARAILTDFANAAFREVKPEADFIDKLVAIYETRRKAGDSFDIAIRTPLSVILASPGFLYLGEPGDESNRRELNDRELAVRLSYFLWSSPPDAELLQLAAENKLHQPEVLRQQVDRLISDPRSATNSWRALFINGWTWNAWISSSSMSSSTATSTKALVRLAAMRFMNPSRTS